MSIKNPPKFANTVKPAYKCDLPREYWNAVT